MLNTTAYTGATAWWDAGYTGEGVDVALIDTGVSRSTASTARARSSTARPLARVPGAEPELSRHERARHVHGRASSPPSPRPTAAWRPTPGSSASRSASPTAAPTSARSSPRSTGSSSIARTATSTSGSSTFVRHELGAGLQVDPLAYAAEQAWKAGIVVVAAGGNYGFQSHMNNAPALADPAIDRVRHRGRRVGLDGTLTQLDDKVPAFSPWPQARRDPECRSDRARHATSRASGSRSRISTRTIPRASSAADYFRGSGTSESAAIVSGAAALVLQKHPGATPDQVKKLLTSTAYEISGEGPGHRRRRAATRDDPAAARAQLDPAVAILGRDRASSSCRAAPTTSRSMASS